MIRKQKHAQKKISNETFCADVDNDSVWKKDVDFDKKNVFETDFIWIFNILIIICTDFVDVFIVFDIFNFFDFLIFECIREMMIDVFFESFIFKFASICERLNCTNKWTNSFWNNFVFFVFSIEKAMNFIRRWFENDKFVFSKNLSIENKECRKWYFSFVTINFHFKIK